MKNPFRDDSDDEIGGMLVAGPLLALISLALVVFWWGGLSWHGLKARFLFHETRCRIESGRLIPTPRDPDQVRPEFRFRVLARGASYAGRGYDHWESESMSRERGEALLARFPPEARVPCWHDPADPGRAVLDRDLNLAWLMATTIILGSLIFGLFTTRWAFQEYRRRMATGSWE